MKKWKSILFLFALSASASAAMASLKYDCTRWCAEDFTKGSSEYYECVDYCVVHGAPMPG